MGASRETKHSVIARIDWHTGCLAVDFSRGRSIGIMLDPDGPHPSFFSESPATTRPLEHGSFIGAMAHGGSCNADVIEFSVHSHGTHTECIGHISPECHPVTETIDQQPTLMRLISIPSEWLEQGCFIPASALAGLASFDGGAVALRTLPNHPSKQWRDYKEAEDFPVLSAAAMKLLAESTLLHFLTDTPSIDSPDSRTLENHSAWWGLDPGICAGVPDPASRSVTEMIFVPDDIEDGDYWLSLQLAPFASDAVPSRPVIYPVTRQSE